MSNFRPAFQYLDVASATATGATMNLLSNPKPVQGNTSIDGLLLAFTITGTPTTPGTTNVAFNAQKFAKAMTVKAQYRDNTDMVGTMSLRTLDLLNSSMQRGVLFLGAGDFEDVTVTAADIGAGPTQQIELYFRLDFSAIKDKLGRGMCFPVGELGQWQLTPDFTAGGSVAGGAINNITCKMFAVYSRHSLPWLGLRPYYGKMNLQSNGTTSYALPRGSALVQAICWESAAAGGNLNTKINGAWQLNADEQMVVDATQLSTLEQVDTLFGEAVYAPFATEVAYLSSIFDGGGVEPVAGFGYWSQFASGRPYARVFQQTLDADPEAYPETSQLQLVLTRWTGDITTIEFAIVAAALNSPEVIVQRKSDLKIEGLSLIPQTDGAMAGLAPPVAVQKAVPYSASRSLSAAVAEARRG